MTSCKGSDRCFAAYIKLLAFTGWKRGCCSSENADVCDQDNVLTEKELCTTDGCNTMDPRNGVSKMAVQGWMLGAILAVGLAQATL